MATPASPNRFRSTAVTSEDEAMFTKVLPSRTAPTIRSRFRNNQFTWRARFSPSFSSWNMRAREAAVRAVSDPEKKAENSINSTITTNEIIRLRVRKCLRGN
jgi:hypothetical protein